MFGFKTALTLAYKRYSWRRHNANNGTTLGRYLVGTDNISIGRGSYGPISILTSDQNPRVVIGSFCSIADGVTFVTGNEHPIDRFSTYPFKVMLLGDKEGEALTKGGIVVEDDVWIGYGATILDGVRIHRGGSSLQEPSSRKTCRPTQSLVECPRNRFALDSIRRQSRSSSHLVTQRWIHSLSGPISICSTRPSTPALSRSC